MFADGLTGQDLRPAMIGAAGAVLVAFVVRLLERRKMNAETKALDATADSQIAAGAHQLVEDYRDQVAELKGDVALLKRAAEILTERVVAAEIAARHAQVNEAACVARLSSLEAQVSELQAAAHPTPTKTITTITKESVTEPTHPPTEV